MLATVAVALALVAYANVALHRRGQAHLATSALLGELDLRLHQDSAMLWKTLADERATLSVAGEGNRERDIIKALRRALPATTMETLRARIADYHALLSSELELLGAGRTGEALALEQQQTEPMFLQLSALVGGLDREAAQAARDANGIANSALILALLLATAAIGWLLFRFERAHVAATEAGSELLAQQRLALQQAIESEALIKHQAMHDPLTGLPNRLLFAERISAAGASLSILLIDLDNFKGVNDTLGHAAGDELLVQVANRLCSSVRAHDLAARLGGDEFAVVLDGTCPDSANAVAERILAASAQPYTVAGTRVHSRASIGVALGHDNPDPELLLHEADLAMYDAKRRGKGTYALYHAGMLSNQHGRRSTDPPEPAERVASRTA